MNLAKIRQKVQIRQAAQHAVQAACLEPVEPLQAPVRHDGSPARPVAAEAPPPYIDAAAAQAPAGWPVRVPLRAKGIDPLDIILAGRAAAGCGDDMPLASEGQESGGLDEYEELLCFRVSDEIYGISIMEIKEIIKPRETTEVPRTPPFIMGVVSLRGVIIPVFNMRERLGFPQGNQNGRERIVIVKSRKGFTGLLVDEVIRVVRITADCLEPAPTVLEGTGRDFVSGIGRTDSMMMILLDVARITDSNLY